MVASSRPSLWSWTSAWAHPSQHLGLPPVQLGTTLRADASAGVDAPASRRAKAPPAGTPSSTRQP